MAISAKQIQQSEQRLMNALRTSNADEFENMLHEKLLFRIPSGHLIGKKEHVESLREGELRINELHTENQLVQVIGNNAVVSVIHNMQGEYKGTPFEGRFHYIRVWRSESNGYKVIGGVGVQHDQ